MRVSLLAQYVDRILSTVGLRETFYLNLLVNGSSGADNAVLLIVVLTVVRYRPFRKVRVVAYNSL